jgi:HTH-type transcriptional regulator / antitoxin HigA
MTEKLKPFINTGPGDIIKDELEIRNWTQEDLAEITGMSLKNINHLLNNKIAVSTEMARILGKVFGQSANFWINLDVNFRNRLKEESVQEKEAEIKSEIFKYMPVSEMVKKRWVPKHNGLNSLEKNVKKFWGINKIDLSFLENTSCPAFRTSETLKKNFNSYYACVWYKMAQNCSERFKVPGYNKNTVQQISNNFSKYTTDEKGVSEFINDLNSAGIKFFVLSHLQKTYMDGAAFFVENNPVIVYTLRHDRIDNFWFVMAHELAHVVLHLDNFREGFMDDLSSPAGNDRENEANLFAQKILNIDKLDEFSDYSRFREDQVREAAVKYGVHPALILGALQKRTGNYRSSLNSKLKRKVSDLIPKKYFMG